jgi:hypothetical protein
MKRIIFLIVLLFAFPAYGNTIELAEFSNKWYQAVNKHHVTTVPQVNGLLSDYSLSASVEQVDIDALTVAERVVINDRATLILHNIFSDLGASTLSSDLSSMGYANIQAAIDDLPNIYVSDLTQMQNNLTAVNSIVVLIQGGADGVGESDFTTTILKMLVAFRNQIATSQPTMGVIR